MSGASRARRLLDLLPFLRWAALAAGALVTILVVGATLGPIETRPHVPLSADFERMAAYAVMVAAYVVARPRHWRMILLLSLALAGLLELGQVLTQSRHGRIHDVLFKMAGCGLGVALGLAFDAVYGRLLLLQARLR